MSKTRINKVMEVGLAAVFRPFRSTRRQAVGIQTEKIKRVQGRSPITAPINIGSCPANPASMTTTATISKDMV